MKDTSSVLRGIRSKETKDLIRGLLRDGWTVTVTGGGHLRLRHPGGRCIHTAMTSSDHHAWRALKRNVDQINAGKPTT